MDPADELATQLDAHRRHILDVASGAEEGSWVELTAAYGVAAHGPVTPESLRVVGDALASSCRRTLKEIAKEASAQRVTFLEGRLKGFADDLVVAYQTATRPAVAKLGLGSIFANATAHAGWTNGWGTPRKVIRCRTCGAAQREVRMFDCGYCGGPLFPVQEKAG